MTRWRWASVLRLASVLAALCVTLGLAMVPGVPVAWASGPGVCTEIVSQSDLAKLSLAATGGGIAQLSRTQGVVGTGLTATGTGWPAGAEVLVDAYTRRLVNGADFGAYLEGTLASATISAAGDFTTPLFRAPFSQVCSALSATPDGRAQDGGAMLFLVHTRDGRVRAPLYFTYLTYDHGPSLRGPQVQDQEQGSALALTGVGWEPGEQVSVTYEAAPWSFTHANEPPPFQLSSAPPVKATADAQGAFAVMFPPFHEPADTVIALVAQGSGPRYGDVKVISGYYQLLPPTAPTLRLDHSGIIAGAEIVVSGSNWPAHVSGVIEYCRGQMTLPDMVGLRCLVMGTQSVGAQQLGTFVTDGAGKFRVTVRMPANARLGPITVQARVPSAPFGLIVYAQGQPLTITPTWDEVHPRLARMLHAAPYVAVGAIVLLAALVGVALYLRRRRGGAGAQTA